MLPIQCTVCNGNNLKRVISFGQQPLSTLFGDTSTKQLSSKRMSLSFGYCEECGTLQLIERFSLDLLNQKNPKIKFTEPRKHLPELANKLQKSKIILLRETLTKKLYLLFNLLIIAIVNAAG